MLAPKRPSFRVSSGRTSRSSPTSSAPIQTPTRLPQTRYPSATRRGRVPSIAARCGHRSRFCIRQPYPLQSPPAPTQQLPEYRRDCLPLTGVNWVGTGANWRYDPVQNDLRPTLEHQRGICSHRRLLHLCRCGQSSARAVHCRLLLLPQGQLGAPSPCRRRSDRAREVAPAWCASRVRSQRQAEPRRPERGRLLSAAAICGHGCSGTC